MMSRQKQGTCTWQQGPVCMKAGMEGRTSKKLQSTSVPLWTQGEVKPLLSRYAILTWEWYEKV